MRIHGRVFNRRGDNFVDGNFKITIYEDDGTTKALLYDDDNLVSLTTNPFNLASDGYVDIFCDPGEYKMQVQGLGRFSRYGIVSETNLEMGAWSPDAEMYGHLLENVTPYDVVAISTSVWYPISDSIIAGELGFNISKDDEAISYIATPFLADGADPWFTVSYSCILTQGSGFPSFQQLGVSVNGLSPTVWHGIEFGSDPITFSATDRVEMDDGNKIAIVMRFTSGVGTVEVSDFHMVLS